MAIALGGVGLACGFFAPIELDPDADQASLLGIFITGPGGMVAGLVAGVIAHTRTRTGARR